jgi:GDP-L-fucose synthase
VAPTNLYGPNDNFELESSHVLAALLRKFHEAKTAGGSKVVVWGTGTPRREFMHVDDLADACLHLMRAYEDPAIINIGVGEDISIRELAELIGRIAGFSGSIVYDDTKPDGMPRKLLDISRLKRQGWAPKIPLEDGIRQTYQWYWNTLMEHSVPDSSSCTA